MIKIKLQYICTAWAGLVYSRGGRPWTNKNLNRWNCARCSNMSPIIKSSTFNPPSVPISLRTIHITLWFWPCQYVLKLEIDLTGYFGRCQFYETFNSVLRYFFKSKGVMIGFLVSLGITIAIWCSIEKVYITERIMQFSLSFNQWSSSSRRKGHTPKNDLMFPYQKTYHKLCYTLFNSRYFRWRSQA